MLTFPKCPRPNTLRSLKSSIDICEYFNILVMVGTDLLGSVDSKLLVVA